MQRIPQASRRRAATQTERGGALVFVVSLSIGLVSTAAARANDVLLNEDFDGPRPSDFYNRLIEHERLQLKANAGVGRGNALCASYVGNSDGSDRIIVTEPLARTATECSFCFDVKFEEGFQFVKGGRLHGVGPDNRVVGQRPEDPDAWCARIRFRADGTLETSTSHQDQRKANGDRGERLRPYRLLPGRFYSVTLHVKLNQPDVSDGFTRLYVNGVLVEERTGLRFRKIGGESSEISHAMFNTFYSGHGTRDAPRNLDGSYATCRALFDNFAVIEGEQIRKAPGE